MIEFQQVYKHYATQDIFRDVSFRVNPGERVGIVGPNGAGKSTLFELITGRVGPDRGTVSLPGDIRWGHLRQQFHAYETEDTLRSFTARAIAELEKLHDNIVALEKNIQSMDAPERKRALARLGLMQEDYEHLGGYELEHKAEAALSGLGFRADEFDRPFRAFSGGWQMRAELARVLIARPDLLLLDEPSNYLDLPAVEWVQRYLKDFTGTLLLISHDRFLLESLTDVTLEVAGGQVIRYPGRFSYYIQERKARGQRLAAARANQDRKREQVERFVERFRAKNTKASQVQSRIKQLEKMKTIEVPHDVKPFAPIRIPEAPHSGHEMTRLENAGLTYDGSCWVLREINFRLERGDRTALVGYNGTGKTSLLRLLAGVKDLDEGKRILGHKVILGYQSQEFADTMPPDLTAFDICRKAAPADVDDKAVRTVLGGFGFGSESAAKACKVLSGGEKIRLAFARIFINPPNLLLLDEPTTHLDLQGREALEEALRSYSGTVCLVSHDIAFVRNVATSIVAMTPPGITRYHGGYDYYREKSLLTAAPESNSAGTAEQSARHVRKAKKEERRKEMLALRKRVRDAEQRIGKLETEQAELLKQLSENTDATDYEAMNRRLSTLQTELEDVLNRWENAVEALDAFEKDGA